MTTAQNIHALHEGGYVGQALVMALRECVSYIQDPKTHAITEYLFADGVRADPQWLPTGVDRMTDNKDLFRRYQKYVDWARRSGYAPLTWNAYRKSRRQNERDRKRAVERLAA